MIVPAIEVQSAPQIVEAQGTPPPQEAPEAFRAAFTASVSPSVEANRQSGVSAGWDAGKSGTARAETSNAASEQAARAAKSATEASLPTLSKTLTKTFPLWNRGSRELLTPQSSANLSSLAAAKDAEIIDGFAAAPAVVSKSSVAGATSVAGSDVKDHGAIELAQVDIPSAGQDASVTIRGAAQEGIQDAVSRKVASSPQSGIVSTGKDSVKRATAGSTGTSANAAGGLSASVATRSDALVSAESVSSSIAGSMAWPPMVMPPATSGRTVPEGNSASNKSALPGDAAGEDASLIGKSNQAVGVADGRSINSGVQSANDLTLPTRTSQIWASAIAGAGGSLQAELGGSPPEPVEITATETDFALGAKPTTSAMERVVRTADGAGDKTALQTPGSVVSRLGPTVKSGQVSLTAAPALARPEGLQGGVVSGIHAKEAIPNKVGLSTSLQTVQDGGRVGSRSIATETAPATQNLRVDLGDERKAAAIAGSVPALAGKPGELKQSIESTHFVDPAVPSATAGTEVTVGHEGGSRAENTSASALVDAVNAGVGGELVAQATTQETASSLGHQAATIATAGTAAPAPSLVLHTAGGQDGVARLAGTAADRDASAYATSADGQRTISATPTSLEVGVRDGTEGWLRIRAEVGGQGEVKASLAAASDGGQAMLERQLPALNAFLHSEQMAVTATMADRSLAATTSSHGGAAQQRDANSRMEGYGTGGGSLGHGSGAGAEAGAQQGSMAANVGRVQSTSRPDWTTTSVERSLPAIVQALPSATLAGEAFENGQWLNVRA